MTMKNPLAGRLASEWCGKRLPLEILQSNAGFYIGTADPESGPCSRESVEYFPEKGVAQAALDSGNWTQKDVP
ncbi:hypothetical protein [Limnohabitans sp. DM1]|uniref:hypothetical protein n=1 Tax=Limnohabitans sp. DM1 TaxID=1597955 RepID=UPI000AC44491|nr:hypothetical protein [Limnohabitans sp. DM1]